MRSVIYRGLIAAIAVSVIGASSAAAQDSRSFSVMGGIHALNKNDTAFPDGIISVPLVAGLTYPLSRTFAIEGEFTWLIPVEQDVELASGVTEKRKTPNILAYQGNVRAGWPLENAFTPYVVGGAGAMTLLSDTDANSLPRLTESQTVFALNFGGGVLYDLTSRLAFRADYRTFAALPSNDTAGLSSAGKADPIWMERGTVGLAVRF